jgi:hypothetical protein
MGERQPSIIKKATGAVTAEFLMHSVGIEIIDPDNNLDLAKEHLKTRSGVLLFTHAKNDFFMWTRFIRDNVTSLDNLTALVAQKYLDPSRGIGSIAFSKLLPAWKAQYGIDAYPLVQRKKEEEEKYPNHHWINGRSLVKARNFLKTAGHLVGFSIEGTRSLNGEVGNAEEGSDIVLELGKNSVFIPLAAEFPIGSSIKLYRNHGKIRVHVGMPFFKSDIDADQEQNPEVERKDLILKRLTAPLPPQYRIQIDKIAI